MVREDVCLDLFDMLLPYPLVFLSFSQSHRRYGGLVWNLWMP